MKYSLLTAMFAFSTAPLMGQSAQEIAGSLPAPKLNEQATHLELPQVPGATIEIGGADYAEIITREGEVHAVLSDTPVQVFLNVTKDGDTAATKDFEIVVPGKSAQGNPKPRVVPDILQWQGAQGEWTPGKHISLSWQDAQKADIFAAELRAVLGAEVTGASSEGDKADIALTIVESDLGSEGYRMEVREDGVSIEANSATGLYWGTRTLLQILRTHGGKVPCGTAVDFPRYGLRGFMLDIARTHYTLDELRDVINLMSWFKMNDLHLVINNNFIFHETYVTAGRDPFKESYSAFRLESRVKGADGTALTAQDLFYTKKDFRALIDYAKVRGVNIVPEFDTPGHALSFTRVRPDLIYKGTMRRHEKRRCEMLDASSPETLDFVREVFNEYLLPDEQLHRPVFDGCVMHIGADEFFGEAEDYRKYLDGLLRIVLENGYTPRVWGSLSTKPGKTPVVAKGVQMNLWSTGWMRAAEAVKLGYDVINTNDGHLYIVPYADYYRMDKRHEWVYDKWIPNVIGNEILPAGHPQLLGATFAVWNDNNDLLHTGYGMYDIWDTISSSVDVLSQKMWGLKNAPDSFADHRQLVSDIGDAPCSNPRYTRSEQELTFSAAFDSQNLPIHLGRPAVGPSYHLTMDIELSEAPEGQEQILLSGPEGELIAVMKDGTVGFRRADTIEFSYDAKLPVGKRVVLEIIATPGQTQLLIDGQPIRKLTLNNYRSAEENFQKRTKGLLSTFILPLDELGKSFHGKIHKIELKPNN